MTLWFLISNFEKLLNFSKFPQENAISKLQRALNFLASCEHVPNFQLSSEKIARDFFNLEVLKTRINSRFLKHLDKKVDRKSRLLINIFKIK
jgi:hypothetical protein